MKRKIPTWCLLLLFCCVELFADPTCKTCGNTLMESANGDYFCLHCDAFRNADGTALAEESALTKEELACTVCMRFENEVETVVRMPCCRQQLCEECLMGWIQTQKESRASPAPTCALCRGRLKVNETCPYVACAIPLQGGVESISHLNTHSEVVADGVSAGMGLTHWETEPSVDLPFELQPEFFNFIFSLVINAGGECVFNDGTRSLFILAVEGSPSLAGSDNDSEGSGESLSSPVQVTEEPEEEPEMTPPQPETSNDETSPYKRVQVTGTDGEQQAQFECIYCQYRSVTVDAALLHFHNCGSRNKPKHPGH